MVLRALGVPSEACTLDKLKCRVPSSSIWTVDLAYVLNDFGVRFRFRTKTLGVDPSYKGETFYAPTLDADSRRVNALFAKAAAADVAIERGSVSSAQLQQLLRQQEHMVMALVDRRYLYRSPSSTVSGLVESCFAHCFSGYVGHYVLLTDYDAQRDGYLLNDPAKPTAGEVFVGSRELDSARRSHGTDEDLILIPWAGQAGARDRGAATGATPLSEAPSAATDSTAASGDAEPGPTADGRDARGRGARAPPPR